MTKPYQPWQINHMIIDYNFGKKGVDQMDEAVEEFTCRRKTVRWPLLVFYNMLDIAANNTFILMKKGGSTSSKKQFLRYVSLQLVESYAKHRFRSNAYLQTSIKEAGQLFGFLPSPSVIPQASCKVNRCHVCHKNSRSKCASCGVFICLLHWHFVKSCVCLVCKN